MRASLTSSVNHPSIHELRVINVFFFLAKVSLLSFSPHQPKRLKNKRWVFNVILIGSLKELAFYVKRIGFKINCGAALVGGVNEYLVLSIQLIR